MSIFLDVQSDKQQRTEKMKKNRERHNHDLIWGIELLLDVTGVPFDIWEIIVRLSLTREFLPDIITRPPTRMSVLDKKDLVNLRPPRIRGEHSRPFQWEINDKDIHDLFVENGCDPDRLRMGGVDFFRSHWDTDETWKKFSVKRGLKGKVRKQIDHFIRLKQTLWNNVIDKKTGNVVNHYPQHHGVRGSDHRRNLGPDWDMDDGVTVILGTWV
jgi:hypothetical protein